jgi:DNA-binding CsgD family transcriptional regulator
MAEFWRIILLMVPLIAGAIAVFFTLQMMKRYRAAFISSYFYYLVFLYIFGVYGLAGSGLMQYALTRMEAQIQVVHAARFYTLLLGVPFLMLSKFMLLRSVAEFKGGRLSLPFTTIYFLAATSIFLIYGILIVRFTRFQLGNFQLLISMQRWGFICFMALVYLPGSLWGMITSKKITDAERRQYLRTFLFWYLLYMAFSTVAYALIPLHPLVPYIFIFLFLSWHLVPILFLNLFLEKNHPGPSVQPDFEARLLAFTERFEISNRETEVIRLICKGWSNQEISEKLFISLQTVKDHIHRIFLKTGVKNRVQLTNLIRSG